MDDGGRVPESGLAAAVGVPLVVAEEVAAGGVGLLIIALFAYLRTSLRALPQIAVWLLKGRTCLERKLVEAGIARNLSLSPHLAELLGRAAVAGRPVYVASQRCSPLLDALVASHPVLAGVVTVPRGGLDARHGADQALGCFPDGFVAVLKQRGSVRTVSHAPAGMLAHSPGPLESAFDDALPHGGTLREIVRSLRLHQCVKNSVVFVPLVLSGRFTVPAEIVDTLLAFVALTCVACGTYILNDIWDVADDRAHWSKRERPIASGRLSAATAISLAIVLIPAGLALAAAVSWHTCALLLAYLALTLSYSLYVKTVPFVDGLALATLFTIRLGIGVVAPDAPPAPWLFVFSMFLFASLSYAKRHTEICRTIAHKSHALNVRGYRPDDAPMVLAVGLAAGVGAVMIMVLYIVEEAFRNSFYGAVAWLWGFPPLVFLFVVRIWLVSVRGEMMDDPVAFAIRDKASIGLLGLLLVCFGFAWLG
ncbi:MAG TPA: UbiA family prenyltransferase [Hyphomicrobiaceae bacterium]|nr:UbiA family prenyltransferase [Hyphomicrobiaceae bacterium]